MTDLPLSDDQGPQFDADSDALTRRLDRYDQAIDGHWPAWYTESRESYDFVAGKQWDREDIALMQETGRIPVTFNRTETTIDAVSGAEIMGRQEVTYLPREVNDTGVSDVLSGGAQYIRQNCDAEDEESDASRDCLICGVGWTETRPSYDEEPDGEILIERVDPLEMAADPSSKKANFADARYLRRKKAMSREEAEDLLGGDLSIWSGRSGYSTPEPIVDNPPDQYATGDDIEDETDDVTVCEYQWFEVETFYQMPPPMEGAPPAEFSEEDMESVAETDPRAWDQAVKQTRRVYKRCFRVGGEVRDVQTIEAGEFTYKAMTGKRDRNTNRWYGLVRAMKDPQRFANKFLSSMIDQYVKSAKGGVMVEKGAMPDIRKFEDTWADNSAITVVSDGSLAGVNGPRITPKPTTPLNPALAPMLEYATGAIRDVTGVNLEILGMADRQQAGVLEHQRKQAAYGILSAFFNSFRRYRKIQGRLLLKMMRLYIPEGTMVRIMGEDGQAKYVPLAYQPDTVKYDIIVDEAPASPNQKERTFQILGQFQGLLKDAPPEIMAEFVRYSPLPASVAEKIAGYLMKMAEPQQPTPEQQAQQKLAMAGAEESVRKTASEASKNEADTVLKQAEARSTDAQAAKDLTEAIRNDAEAKLTQTVANIAGQPGREGL